MEVNMHSVTAYTLRCNSLCLFFFHTVKSFRLLKAAFTSVTILPNGIPALNPSSRCLHWWQYPESGRRHYSEWIWFFLLFFSPLQKSLSPVFWYLLLIAVRTLFSIFVGFFFLSPLW